MQKRSRTIRFYSYVGYMYYYCNFSESLILFPNKRFFNKNHNYGLVGVREGKCQQHPSFSVCLGLESSQQHCDIPTVEVTKESRERIRVEL